MEIQKSKVYVLLDERSRVLRCEGGYTMSNIDDVSKWTYIDEGTGDKYNLCQSNYLPKPLFEGHGIPCFKLVNGVATERTQSEIDADIAALPVPLPAPQEQTDALMLDHEERLIYLELGVNNNAVSGS